MTGPALRLVANGLENARVARAVILVFPDTRSTSEWKSGDWPQRAHGLVDELLKTNAAVGVELRGESPSSAKLRDPFPKNKIPIDEINGLWRRSFGDYPESATDDLMKAWIEQSTPDQHALLPVPVAEAGLLLPLERARRGLSLLGSEGELNARTPMRPPASALSAIGRPWLGRPDELAKIASIDQNASDIISSQVLLGPPDVGSWLRGRDEGLDLKDHPYSVHLDADEITRSALGRGDQDLLWLFDRMHALHHAVLNGVTRIADAPPVVDNNDSLPAKRRLQQLLSSPGLMRLFGFARDVYLDFEVDLPSTGLGTLTVTPTSEMSADAFYSAKTSFELSREANLFFPATRAAYNDGNDPQMKCGVRRLGYKPSGKSIYSIVSIEPITSADDDLQAQANCRTSRVTTGPLALVCSDSDAVALEPKYDGIIDFAEELSAPAADRLDIGIDTEDATVKWYSASPRSILYRDPHPTKKEDREWLQRVIEALTPSWLPRTERDAGGVAPSSYRQINPDDKNQNVECFDPRTNK
jgi:hypothetical protein